ncbi:hypothetical protein J5837_14245 [Pseudoxanthomonas helianthi]|uniref:Uncharacterized protein n=1 Tax=Pseudoxanthomonas helianthi TaxID=1453541 RepID=A0A940X836_9GAMM|nr:hypothetical protein [Pseudoxanthomonas helianthi]MBP3985570.1 hypothetical protein [Pseudoxanthomonas helianthi]
MTPLLDANRADQVEGETPLARVLELIQGEGIAQTDAAIARLPPEQLDQLATAAQRKCEANLDLLCCLVDCADVILLREPAEAARDRLLRLNGHLATLLGDHERLTELHENAVYYRDHPQVADRVANYWRRNWA